MADRVVENEQLASRFFDDEEFSAIVNNLLSRVVYKEIREGEPATAHLEPGIWWRIQRPTPWPPARGRSLHSGAAVCWARRV